MTSFLSKFRKRKQLCFAQTDASGNIVHQHTTPDTWTEKKRQPYFFSFISRCLDDVLLGQYVATSPSPVLCLLRSPRQRRKKEDRTGQEPTSHCRQHGVHLSRDPDDEETIIRREWPTVSTQGGFTLQSLHPLASKHPPPPPFSRQLERNQ